MPKLLYNQDDQSFDVVNILTFINRFTHDIGIVNADINPNKIEGIVAGMRQDFPHCDGEDAASPFKKAANFLCFFVSEKPISNGFPVDKVGEPICRIPNHQNALVGFWLVRKALHKATLYRDTGPIVIENEIQISKHSMADIVDSLAGISAVTHFKMVSVLLEQMVYKTNPDCQYDVS